MSREAIAGKSDGKGWVAHLGGGQKELAGPVGMEQRRTCEHPEAECDHTRWMTA